MLEKKPISKRRLEKLGWFYIGQFEGHKLFQKGREVIAWNKQTKQTTLSYQLLRCPDE